MKGGIEEMAERKPLTLDMVDPYEYVVNRYVEGSNIPDEGVANQTLITADIQKQVEAIA